MIRIKKNLRARWNRFLGFVYFVRFLVVDLKKVNESRFVFIFPVYQTGGAEKVHLNIVKSLDSGKKLIFFTENSSTKNFLNEFKACAEIIEINTILTKKNKWVNNRLHFILVRRLNKSSSLKVVFGSNTYFFYQMVNEIKQSAVKIDLFHAFTLPEDHRVNNIVKTVKSVDFRVLINEKALEDIKTIYSKNQIESYYYDRLRVINNGIDLMKNEFVKKSSQSIKVGFVGRWSEEKRPEIYLKVAQKILSVFDNVEFVMAGIGMKANLKIINEAGISFLGEIVAEEELTRLYQSLTFVLVPSKREGFPMVIMEAMANGVIPIATDVGGISEHIKNFENGILIDEQDEDQIIEVFFNVLKELVNNLKKREKLSQNVFEYAYENFGIEKFQESYKRIFEAS